MAEESSKVKVSKNAVACFAGGGLDLSMGTHSITIGSFSEIKTYESICHPISPINVINQQISLSML